MKELAAGSFKITFLLCWIHCHTKMRAKILTIVPLFSFIFKKNLIIRAPAVLFETEMAKNHVQWVSVIFANKCLIFKVTPRPITNQ